MERIDFEAKSDRELLILVAQKTNEIVIHLAKLNDTVARHESRLVLLEASGGCNAKTRLKLFGNKWQLCAAITAIIFGVIYGIGKAYGWW